ncbi:hypothetical protein [Burkholderia ubonensis]|uniref:hypothetical protein n=1 Tax=Burkholderia ubonensis TaxID=101571 RepID=UPI0015C360B8|nr:hypothetical protein [Burkholderia ubonensis]
MRDTAIGLHVAGRRRRRSYSREFKVQVDEGQGVEQPASGTKWRQCDLLVFLLVSMRRRIQESLSTKVLKAKLESGLSTTCRSAPHRNMQKTRDSRRFAGFFIFNP